VASYDMGQVTWLGTLSNRAFFYNRLTLKITH
jgi:hypothetical protein